MPVERDPVAWADLSQHDVDTVLVELLLTDAIASKSVGVAYHPHSREQGG